MSILNNRRGSRRTRRIVGLSKNQATPPLLNNIKRPSTAKVARNVDDPPVSSDDEDADTTISTGSPTEAVTPSKSPLKGNSTSRAPNTRTLTSFVANSEEEDSGDGDERAARASIQSTSFGTTRQARSKRKDSPIERAEDLEDLDGKRRKTGVAAFQRAQHKEPRTTPPTSSGEHLRDELGFTKCRKSKTTYKKREKSSQEQPDKEGSAKTRVKSQSMNRARTGEKKEPAKLRVPALLQSPEKPKKDKLRLPSGSPPLSPTSKPTLKLSSSITSPRGYSGSRRQKKMEKLKVTERSVSPPPAVFKMPVSISDLQLRSPRKDRTVDSLTDDPLATEDEDGQTGSSGAKDETKSVEAAAVCPWCGEPVDKELLDDFAKGRRLNVRLQSKFCQKHKKQTAEKLWQQKSYPDVEWDGLEDRFEKHHDVLLGVINGGASHFRSVHEKNISSGKARLMKKEGNMNPGYYGPRGFNLMCDYLVNEFSELLKEKAVDDRVIAGRGSAAFIQTVLVAELAVRLIMEDMRVAEEEARVILDESKVLGEMVHGET